MTPSFCVFLHVISALLLILCSSTSCLGNQYEYCLWNASTCGGFHFGYPFGKNGSGCGDPAFQILSCDSGGHPLLNINGHEYHIVENAFLGNNSDLTMTIVNDNMWANKCNVSGNYSQFWWSTFDFHIRADTYTNQTLWGKCNGSSNGLNFQQHWRFCEDNRYYFSTRESASTHLCQTPLQWPCRINIIEDLQINEAVQEQGVTFYLDFTRYHSCEACLRSNGACGYSHSEPTTFLCYCPDATTHPDICPANGNGNKTATIIIIGCSIGGFTLIAIIALVLLLMYYVKCRKSPRRSSNSKVEKFLREYAYEMPTRYSYSHLKNITNNFAEKLGEGGFGVVYKGKLGKGRLVAVKLLDRHKHSESQFMNEVATIGRVHHVHLVRLLGYCFESPTCALVYEYMANGSLDKFIFAGKEKCGVLRWDQLYSIALGAARGVAYLHQDCEKRIIHFDIKPHNILLDAEFTPKVADFGVAKLCGKKDDDISMTAARGTPGYVAPEVCDINLGSVTDKADVYSFGMLLLEIVGERKNNDWKVSRSSQIYFPEWAFKLLQSGELGMRVRGGGEMEAEDEEKATRLTKVGLWCIQHNYRDRPSMSRVVQMLEGNGNDVANPPFPFDSSSAAFENPQSSSSM